MRLGRLRPKRAAEPMSDGDRPSPEEIELRIEEGKAWTRETEPPPRSDARPSGPPPSVQRRAPEPPETVVDDPPAVAPHVRSDKP